MKLPTQVAFRGVPHSEAIETRIREKAAWLEEFCDSIMGCRVVVETPHRRHHQGKLFHVRIDLTVPDAEIVVSREPQEHHEYEDVYVAIRDAFDDARRQLEDYVRRHGRQVKTHEPTPRGRVLKLFPDEGYGFIGTPDGREIYFHARSVLHDGFSALKVGDEVRFSEEAGEEGPQASTVHPVARR